MKLFILITIVLSLSGCSIAENDVIDQAIAARIYNRNQGVAVGEIAP